MEAQPCARDRELDGDPPPQRPRRCWRRRQRSSGLALGLLADCSTKIVYAQESGEATKTGTSLGLSSTEVAQLPNLVRGEGLWRLGERAFVITHVMTPGELACFDTNQRMIGNPRQFPGSGAEFSGTEG